MWPNNYRRVNKYINTKILFAYKKIRKLCQCYGKYNLFTFILLHVNILSKHLYYIYKQQFDYNDKLPKYFCRKCISILNTAYDFKIQCEKSHQRFLALLRHEKPAKPLALKIENINSVDNDNLNLTIEESFECTSNSKDFLEIEIDPAQLKLEYTENDVGQSEDEKETENLYVYEIKCESDNEPTKLKSKSKTKTSLSTLKLERELCKFCK